MTELLPWRGVMAIIGAARILLSLYFIAIGAFVTTCNYITFRLLAAPYNLSPATVAWIFAAYLVGSYRSALAGRLADRYGRVAVVLASLGLLLAGAALTPCHRSSESLSEWSS